MNTSNSSLQLPSDHIVILIHGIRTHAVWEDMVKVALEKACAVRVIPLRYGYFDSFRMLFPFFTRRGPINVIMRELEDIRRKHPAARISVIAHSFGTYILARILEDHPAVQLHSAILVASIVSTNYRWDKVGDQISLPIISECGTRDLWPVLAASLTVGYGPSGTFGSQSNRIYDRYHPFRHSAFFTEEFVQRYWTPFYSESRLVESPWNRERPSPPFWLSLMALFHIKYFVPFLLTICILMAMLGGGVQKGCESIFDWDSGKLCSNVDADLAIMDMEFILSQECTMRTSPPQPLDITVLPVEYDAEEKTRKIFTSHLFSPGSAPMNALSRVPQNIVITAGSVGDDEEIYLHAFTDLAYPPIKPVSIIEKRARFIVQIGHNGFSGYLDLTEPSRPKYPSISQKNIVPHPVVWTQDKAHAAALSRAA